MDNLSDGTKDGFALFYIRDGKLCSVLLNEEQAGILNLSLKMVFSDKPARIVLADRKIIENYLDNEVG